MLDDIIIEPVKMTNEIAFDLGAFNYPNFYDGAVWDTNEGDFKYAYFFNWDNFHDSKIMLWGELDEETFETLEHKYQYIQGRLSLRHSSYYGPSSAIIEEDKMSLNYANSFKSRDRFMMWAKELIWNKFRRSKEWRITIFDGGRWVPAAPGLILEADPDIIKYFVEGQYHKEI